MNPIKKTILLSGLLLVQPLFCVAASTTDVLGSWNALILQGDFKAFSPDLDKVKWLVMNQARTRDDSAKGSRMSENLLFAQVGYQVNLNVSFWLGYAHGWKSGSMQPQAMLGIVHGNYYRLIIPSAL